MKFTKYFTILVIFQSVIFADDIIDISVKGMSYYEAKYGSLVDNVSNIKTPGYRSKSVTIKTTDSNYDKVINYGTNFEAGAINHTNNPLDLAIEGDGFFTIMTPDGIMYTRDGRFKVDAYQNLVTSTQGFPVIGEGNSAINISPHKTLIIDTQGNIVADNIVIDKLQILAIKDKTKLISINSVLFRLSDNYDLLNSENANYKVIQGAVEQSNINLTDQMIKMNTNSRKYDAMTKVVQERLKVIDSAINAAKN